MRRPKLSFLIGALCCAPFAYGQSLSGAVDDFQRVRSQGKSTLEVQIDNDSLLLKRDDGFYTSGMKLGQRYSLRESNRQTSYGWRIGQELYTAMNINLPPALIGPPDHPYAGWLYGGFFKDTEHADGGRLKLGIDVGCLGPCAGGEWTQTKLHRILRQPLPKGWAKQVRNEWGVVLHGDYTPTRWTVAPWLDVTPNVHGRFGNIFTDAGAGLMVRAGNLPAWSDSSGLHGFLRVDASTVAYNASLQGGLFSSGNPHTVKPKRVIGEAEAGLAWRAENYGLTVSVVRRANEIEGLSNRRGAQNFARLAFSYTP